MRISSEYRGIARNRLKGNWGTAILVCLIIALVSSALTMLPFVGNIISMLLAGQLVVGELIYFVRLHRNKNATVGVIFEDFGKNWIDNFLTYLLQQLYIILWTLLFIIPGIVKSYAYSMTMYLKSQNPALGHNEAISLSQKIMNGKKEKLFHLHLSFIGWAILSVFTLGIGFIFLLPYVQASVVAFYEDAYIEYKVSIGEVVDADNTNSDNNEAEIQIEE